MEKENAKKELLDLLSWIADHQTEWIQICKSDNLSPEECITWIDRMEDLGFVQLIPVILTQNCGNVRVDDAIRSLLFHKLVEGWSDKTYDEISDEIITYLRMKMD